MMTTFKVTIPDDKTSFFLQFVELIGASAESEDFELTNEIKEILDERLKTEETLFVSAREAINKITTKYGIST
ncbi:MAG: hypothetical protein LRY55_08025 [Leadbetterella sp.]|nr:hypothetical protein [Leadbetterella sp.]